jgi:hypothetical protein
LFASVPSKGPPARIDEFLAQTDGNISRLRTLPGFQGVDVLINRESGKILTITLRDSEQSLDATTQAANQIRAEGVRAERGDQPPTYEVFERAVHVNDAE